MNYTDKLLCIIIVLAGAVPLAHFTAYMVGCDMIVLASIIWMGILYILIFKDE